MIIHSIDLETTGTDSENNQVLEIGIVKEDTMKPLSYEESEKLDIVINHAELSGNVYALNMNARLIKILSEYNNGEKSFKEIKEEYDVLVLSPFDAYIRMCTFLRRTGSPVLNGIVTPLIAGKNFASFDREFLNNLFNYDLTIRINEKMHFSQRYIDPTNYFIENTDKQLPNLRQCKERAGITNVAISHRAVEDAWDVIECIRIGNSKIYNK